MVFGLFNAFILLWFWDILFHYACLGLIAFAFRRLSPKALIIGAVICLVVQTTRENVDAYRDRKHIYKGELIAKMDTTVTKLTDEQKAEMGPMIEMKEKSTEKGSLKKWRRA
ncbi:MAG: hypothetical protein WKF59_16420 [Chitinophagaceae bacterium]